MTLYELSLEYTAGADLLKARIDQLRAQLAQTENEQTRLNLTRRIRTLTTMWRQTREIAQLTAHYYDRGYRRNAHYII